MSKGRFIFTFEDDNGDVYHTQAGEMDTITFSYGDHPLETLPFPTKITLTLSKAHTNMHVKDAT